MRIQPRDRKRLVRALEVFFQYRPAADRALRRDGVAARSRCAGDRPRAALPAPWLAERLARRVDAQFAAGLLDEIRGLLAAGVPPRRGRSAVSSTGR